jgi:predicted dehydrogenase/threonine dehydrogenase-like Zn-dependent dehydrogenase
MKQVLVKKGKVVVAQVPAPMVDDGCVLVEVAYSLISAGTEISNVERSGKPLVQHALEQPKQVKQVIDYLRRQGIHKTVAKVQGQLGEKPLGYSCSGIVLQVGRAVRDLHPGDRVACAGGGKANHAELVVVPRNLVVKVPDSCDLKAAASVTLGAIALQGVRRADPRLGDSVTIIGLGLLGQITMQLLKIAGCKVIGIDLDLRRVAIAKQLGIDYAYNPAQVDINNEMLHLTGDHGADATIITAASPSDAIVQQAMELTRKKGRVVIVGDVGLGLKRSPFYEKEIDFLISCSYGPGRYDERYEEHGEDYPYAYVRWTENRNMGEYLHLVAEGKIEIKTLLEREYSLAEAPQAFEALREEDEKPLGVILCYLTSEEIQPTTKMATKVVLKSRSVKGKINVAVVGAGNFAKSMHLPNLQQLSDLYQIRAIVDALGSNANSVAHQFNANYASTDYEDVLNDPDLDAVIICTHHHLHAQQTISALKAGKHVYCEKPLALNNSELDDILACYNITQADLDRLPPEARDLQPILMVGFNRRFSPAAQQIKKIVSNRQNPLMVLYRVNGGYIPADNWVQGPEGGGRIVGEMCHMFDLLNYWVGSQVESISVEAISPQTENVLSDDNVSTTMKYRDGSVCTLLYSALGANNWGKEYTEVYVDGKTLVLDDFKRLEVYGGNYNGWKGRIADKGHKNALEAFAHSIMSGKWVTPLESFVMSSRISIIVAEMGSSIGG